MQGGQLLVVNAQLLLHENVAHAVSSLVVGIGTVERSDLRGARAIAAVRHSAFLPLDVS